MIRSLVLPLLLTATCLSDATAELTPEQWRQDLAVVAEQLPALHKEPFHTVSQADFETAVADLHQRIPTLQQHQIIVELASIVALINDGHTSLRGWYFGRHPAFRWYPIALHAFADGIYVRQAHPDFADLAGARLVSIAGVEAGQAAERAGRAISTDNRYGKQEYAPLYMTSPEVLHATGVIDDMDQPAFEFEQDGKTFVRHLPPQSGPWPQREYGFVQGNWVDARTAGPKPLWLKNLDKIFWYEYLPEEKTLYVQQNQIQNAADMTVAEFYDEVFDFVDSHDVERLVLDLRLNGGGNNYRNRPVVVGTIAARKINQKGKLFTIIGRRTFSAAQNLVNELENFTETTFVGEPSSERVNFFGDTKPIHLPHSGLVVRASWLWWQNHDPRDTRRWTAPEIAAPMTFANYRDNVDPAMAAIRHYDQRFQVESLVTHLQEVGLDVTIDQARKAVEDPANQFRNLEAEINALGYRLLSQRETTTALDVFRLNVALFPESWNVYDSLGETYRLMGRHDDALREYRRSLQIRPDSPTGLAAVQDLEG